MRFSQKTDEEKQRMNLAKRILAFLVSVILCTGFGMGGLAEASEPYRIYVTDTDGNPVQGVSVQLCSDTMCTLGKTGADGIATIRQEPGTYTVHVLKAPAGYLADDTEYSAPETPGMVTIVLEKEKAGTYQVLVCDPDGNPVSGVAVQFCSETECMLGKTGADGIASFEQGPGSYTVHVLKVPQG